MSHSPQEHKDASEQEEKNQYEDEAEESSDRNFIDDSEIDESDSGAIIMAKETCAAMSSRKKWKDSLK